MIKCFEIKPTKNPQVVQVGFVQVLDEFASARGFANPKKAWITADSEKNTFSLEKTFNKDIEAIAHDEPQYEGHEPFEKTGKYYTMKIV